MFKKVLWATDGSDHADQALSLARELAAGDGAELLAFHCDEMTIPGKAGGAFPVHADEPELKEKIRQQVAELEQAGIAASLRMTTRRVGGAAAEIADAAREWPADVIVTGTRGHTPLGGLLLGSVTQRLLHISPCPVLVVPSRSGTDG
jgi:nucleotide-binding universal stress UspA family protein